MHRTALKSLLVLPLLVGCTSFFTGLADKPLPPPPPPAPVQETVGTVTKAQDKSDARISAAVAEARVQNKAGKPDKVEAELSVAASYLPAPTVADLAVAHQRAEKADPAEYKAAIEYGMALQKRIDDAWSKMEAESKANAEAIALRDAEIKTLRAEILKVRHDADRNLYSMLAVGLLGLGGLAIAFSRYIAGAGLMISGAIVGAIPYLLESPWFAPALGVLTFVVIGFTLWHFTHDAKIKAT